MEDCGLVDPSDEIHIAALHYAYKPRINASLGLFKNGHNQEPISTEQNFSPEQLWIDGMLRNWNPNGTVAREFETGVN